jgi:hypothetical protein
MEQPQGQQSAAPAPRASRRRSFWPFLYGAVLLVYAAAFLAVIWIGAGFGVHPTPAAPVAAVIVGTPTVAVVATPTAPPSPTPLAPTPTPTPPRPTAIPPTPAPDPNVDIRVPLAASNTGTLRGQKVTILNITDNARSSVASVRPAVGAKYITVEATVENVGDAPAPPGKWQLRTADGTFVGSVVLAGFGDPLPSTGILLPRAPTTGIIVFVVPANAKLGSIQYLPDPALRGALFFDAA